MLALKYARQEYMIVFLCDGDVSVWRQVRGIISRILPLGQVPWRWPWGEDLCAGDLLRWHSLTGETEREWRKQDREGVEDKQGCHLRRSTIEYGRLQLALCRRSGMLSCAAQSSWPETKKLGFLTLSVDHWSAKGCEFPGTRAACD